MKLLPATINPSTIAIEVVRRLFINGAILDQRGRRLVQVEMTDMYSTAFAYASAQNLPKIERIVDGEAYRCQLIWDKSAFPIGWRILGLTRTPARGDTAFELVPRARILTEAHVVQLDLLISCVVEPTLRRFLSDVFSDRDFVMRYFNAPIDTDGYAQYPEGPLGAALRAISHYWSATGLTDSQRQLGAIALLFTEPGLTWISSKGGQLAASDKCPQFPSWAVRYMTRVQPRWWRVLLTLWAEQSVEPVAKEAYVSPVMRAAYHLAIAHARTVYSLNRFGNRC